MNLGVGGHKHSVLNTSFNMQETWRMNLQSTMSWMEVWTSEYFPGSNGKSFNILPSALCHKRHVSERLIWWQRLICKGREEWTVPTNGLSSGSSTELSVMHADGYNHQVHSPLPNGTPNFIRRSAHPPRDICFRRSWPDHIFVSK